MSKIIFVSYATGPFEQNIFWNKIFVKLFIRPYKTFYLTDKDLKKEKVFHDHMAIFSEKIGAGYWAWKPWAILHAMKNASENDIVIYHDCGFGLRYKNFSKPLNLIKYAQKYGVMPGVLVPEHGKNKDWTHEECFKIMNCYKEEYFETPQVEASISAWKVTKSNQRIVKEWLSYCLDTNVISYSATNHSSCFAIKGHRYDQSILTNLVVKHKLKPVNQSINCLHVFKSVFLLNMYMGRSNWCTYELFKITLTVIKITRKIRYFLKKRNRTY